MFERLKSVFSPSNAPPELAGGEALSEWSASQGLQPVVRDVSQQVWEGRWLGQALTVQCGASSRPYISGMELSVKAELGVRGDVRVVLLSRALRQSLEVLSERLFNEVTDSLQTTDRPLPEEVSWLSMYRDVGWAGPADAFFRRFAVLTDNTDLARDWLDDAVTAEIAALTQSWNPNIPVWWAILRGKLYLRMQWSAGQSPDMIAQALNCFEQLGQRAQGRFAA